MSEGEIKFDDELEGVEVATASVAEAAGDEGGTERRRAYRLNKVLGATLTSEEGESKSTRLFIIDISESGFKATDHQPLGEGEFVISIVLVKGEEPFVSKLRVVWVKELTVSGMFQMGCEFKDTAPEHAGRLKLFIEEEQKKNTAPSKGISIKNPWTMIS